jgi:hypothetical protein
MPKLGVFLFSLASRPTRQSLHHFTRIATMADILTQLQDAVDQVRVLSKQPEIC